MRLSTPSFWRTRGPVAFFLLPLSWIYGLIVKIKNLTKNPYKSRLPVLCIGGAVAGGSGKTPAVHAVIAGLLSDGTFQRPAILTRGYGGALHGPTKVDPEIHSAGDVGDEALLHARIAPTIVAHNRADGAVLAEAMGADIIVMDDGLQNNSLHKDCSLLVIDGQQGLGNGFLLPAGPLREPFPDALKKCVGVLSIGSNMDIAGKDVFRADVAITSEHDKEKNYFAFAGIGHPDKFKETLKTNGFLLTGFSPFPDHHVYTEKDMDALIDKAGDSTLVTTGKDFVKIPHSYHKNVEVVSIALRIEKEAALMELLKRALKKT